MYLLYMITTKLIHFGHDYSQQVISERLFWGVFHWFWVYFFWIFRLL